MKYTLLAITAGVLGLALVENMPRHGTLGASAGNFIRNYRHSVPQGSLQIFTSRNDASLHCVSDPLVWVDSRIHVAYPPSMPQYEHTPHSGYACKHESLAAGNRELDPGTPADQPSNS